VTSHAGGEVGYRMPGTMRPGLLSLINITI